MGVLDDGVGDYTVVAINKGVQPENNFCERSEKQQRQNGPEPQRVEPLHWRIAGSSGSKQFILHRHRAVFLSEGSCQRKPENTLPAARGDARPTAGMRLTDRGGLRPWFAIPSDVVPAEEHLVESLIAPMNRFF